MHGPSAARLARASLTSLPVGSYSRTLTIASRAPNGDWLETTMWSCVARYEVERAQLDVVDEMGRAQPPRLVEHGDSVLALAGGSYPRG